MEFNDMEKNNIDVESQEVCDAGDLQGDDGHYAFTILEAKFKSPLLEWLAMLEVRYFWNSTGTQFNCVPTRYVVSSNGRNEGNIFLAFGSESGVYDQELTTNAIQDGRWHQISGGGAVPANGEFADLFFKYIYDLALAPDPNAVTGQTVFFEPEPPRIINPGVVCDPRPDLNGYGIPGAFVSLYQRDFYEAPLGIAEVKGDGTWMAPLAKDLSMTENFPLTARQTFKGKNFTFGDPGQFCRAVRAGDHRGR